MYQWVERLTERMSRVSLLISVVGLLLLTEPSATIRNLPPFFHGRPAAGFRQYGDKLAGLTLPDAAGTDPYPWLKRENFTQKLDHFNPADNRTYIQRYWYNPSFTANKSIAFLLIEGEGIATDLWVGYDQYQWLKMAKKHQADVFQLEHRCFGYSRPFNDLKVSTLEYCTIEQALEDVKAFILAINVKYGFDKPRWITFGGSYPGILSALFRRDYPELTAGAVSSSAPIYFTFDSWEYAVSVEDTLSTVPGCADAVKESFSVAQQLSMSLEGRKQLNDLLDLEPAFTESATQHDIDNLFANLFAVWQGIVQYTRDGRNDDTKGQLGVNGACSVIKNTIADHPVRRLRNVVKWFNAFPSNGGDASALFPNSYDDLIAVLRNETFDDEHGGLDNAANRGWVWLQCTQIGAQQTTDQGRNIFGQVLPLNYFIDMCTDGYGEFLTAAEQVKRTDKVRRKYGMGYDFKATNIVLANGSFDPWHKMGFYESAPANNVTAILIDGTAHCADMYPQYDGEPPALAAARSQIEAAVASFLGEKA